MQNFSDEFFLERLNMAKNQLIPSQIYDERILYAMENVPRHIFVQEKWRTIAYSDAEIPMNDKRKLLTPLVFAKMLSYANLKENALVLDVGCGSGYSTAILSKIVKNVVSIDNDKDLLELAAHHLSMLQMQNCNFIHTYIGELNLDDKLFDTIIVNGLIKNNPSASVKDLLNYLKKSGMLIIIEESSKIPVIVRYFQLNNNMIREELETANYIYID